MKGWLEALLLMKQGSKWQIFVPADLAYGKTPVWPYPAQNSTLIFEMELLSVSGGGPIGMEPKP